MTRDEISSIEIGQAGLYEFDRACTVVELRRVQKVQSGARKGKLFRYVLVQSSTRGIGTIGFIVRED